jgi:hypothetical protein
MPPKDKTPAGATASDNAEGGLQQQIANLTAMMTNMLTEIQQQKQQSTLQSQQLQRLEQNQQQLAQNRSSTSSPTTQTVTEQTSSSNHTQPEHPNTDQSGKSNYKWLTFKIDKFSATLGGQSWKVFLEDFNRCCVYSGVEEEDKAPLLKHYIKDMARVFYDDIVKDHHMNISFADLCKEMSKQCDTVVSQDQIALELSSIRQGHNESVSDFYHRFMSILSYKVDKTVEPWLLTHLD